MSYLERYLQGQHEQVWNELLALGPLVCEEPLQQEALAVVQEVMRRIRQNLEELIPRLVHLGYVFGYDHVIREQLRLGIDWGDHHNMLRWTRDQPPVFLPAQLDAEYRAKLQALGLEHGSETVAGEAPAPDMKANVDALNRLVGPLPLALQAWYEQVGAVNFYGFYAAWVGYLPPELQDQHGRYLMDYCDPLQVCALDDVRMSQLVERRQRFGLAEYEFAPDPAFKNYTAGSSTPYAVSLMQPGIDGLLAGFPPVTFVQYVRTCFRWAGFPGMAEWPSVPVDDLAFLTEGLLPF